MKDDKYDDDYDNDDDDHNAADDDDGGKELCRGFAREKKRGRGK